jgi:hypothetical protein
VLIEPGEESETEEQVDARLARPEPFEHAFGAPMHPAEAEAVSQPDVPPAPQSTAGTAIEAPTEHEQPSAAAPEAGPETDRSTAPEQ